MPGTGMSWPGSGHALHGGRALFPATSLLTEAETGRSRPRSGCTRVVQGGYPGSTGWVPRVGYPCRVPVQGTRCYQSGHDEDVVRDMPGLASGSSYTVIYIRWPLGRVLRTTS